MIEVSIMDYLQDLLISVEDTKVNGHSAAVVWNYETASDQSVTEEVLETPPVSIAGILGW